MSRELTADTDAVDGDELTEAVDTITWTATGDTQIGPGQFQEFWISAGPMPTVVDSPSFPAVQTYSSGEEVAWIDPPNPDGSEPDRPAPTLQLVAATSSHPRPSERLTHRRGGPMRARAQVTRRGMIVQNVPYRPIDSSVGAQYGQPG